MTRVPVVPKIRVNLDMVGRICVTFWLVALLMAATGPVLAQETVVVQRVVDGDTFDGGGVRYRVFGVDAPEMDTPRGPAAKEHLRAMIEGKSLSCVTRDRDRYGRTVAQCFIEGIDIACQMVKDGMAWDYTRYSRGYYKACAR